MTTQRITRSRKGRAEQPDLPRKAFSAMETAYVLGVNYETVLGLIHKGELGAIKIGGEWRVPEAEIDRYLKAAVKEPA